MSDIIDDFEAWKAAQLKWTFETFHTPACRLQLQDPGARCVCRPPFAGAPGVAR